MPSLGLLAFCVVAEILDVWSTAEPVACENCFKLRVEFDNCFIYN